MLSTWIVISLCLSPDDPKPKPRPAALVLDLKGKVEIRPIEGVPKATEIGDLVYPDERIVIPADGAATVAILGAGAKETLKPGTEATVGPKGCVPPEAVASRTEQRKALATTMKGIQPVPNDARKAGTSFRAGPADPPAITPIFGATVSTDRPLLAWPAAEKARTYRVKLLASGSGRELWRSEVKSPKVDFPPGKDALSRGHVFLWEVTDQDFRPVASGRFTVADDTDLKLIEELKSLADSSDRADQYSAVLAYRRLGAYAEAIGACERLAKQAPSVKAYRDVLAELNRHAGLAMPRK
jgi:hypothetical protein